jgi:hypothetical protein
MKTLPQSEVRAHLSEITDELVSLLGTSGPCRRLSHP